MNFWKIQEHLKNKLFLIGLRFINQEGQQIEKYQTSANLIELNNSRVFTFKRSNGEPFNLPYHKESILKARKGRYRSKTSGEIVLNPDYIIQLNISTYCKEEIQSIKKYGLGS